MTAVRFTSWARLEPSVSDPALQSGLSAEVADPAWFLARQWQLGELTGDDAATPALVEVTAEVGLPTKVRLGGAAASAAYDPTTVPLDVLAEREPAPATVPVLFAAEVSLMIAEELEAAGLGARARRALLTDLRGAFPLPELSAAEAATLSPESAALLAAVAGMAFDGVAAVRAAAADLPASAAGAEWDNAMAMLRPWVAQRLPASSAWVPEQFGSRIEIGVAARGGGVAYRAERVAGDELAWWSFDRISGGLGAGAAVAATLGHPLPATTLSFPGAPAARYWQMEDAAIDLGAVGVAPNELARLVVLEYVLVYANDMLVVPLELPYGSRSVVTGVTVVDTVGDRIAVQPASVLSGGAFRMWEVTGDPGALLVPPVAASTLHGPVVEDVLVARDEQSNLAWLIELTGTDAAGAPVDMRRLVPPPAAPAPGVPAPAGAARPPWRWRLTSEVPHGWHPLLPVIDAAGRTRLMPGTVPSDAPSAPPRSTILIELQNSGLPLAAVPPEGVRLRRRVETARWVDGSRHTWSSRAVHAGGGDAGSGLLFDVLEPGQR